MNELADLTTCLLCGQIFTGPRVQISGRQNGRLQNYLLQLGKHFNEKLPDHAKAMNIRGAEFMGLLFLLNFRTSDTELQTERDRLRWQIHQQTLNARIPDEKLKEKCTALSSQLMTEAAKVFVEFSMSREDAQVVIKRAESQCAATLIEVFTGLRDVLEEPNKYPAQQQSATAEPTSAA